MEVRGKAFLLRPDIPPGGMPRKARPGEDTGSSLSEPLNTYAQEAGLIMRRPPLTAYTMPALEATEFASEQGQFQAFHQATYRAYWEHGRDIGQVTVLREVAQEVGLDPSALEQCLSEGRYRSAVQEQFQEALDLGFHGIPAFRIGEVLFTGAHPYDFFRRVMDEVLAQPQT